ncbi:hypothetical protein GW17_00028572 [Ensete ventricosum]|nr:hypothetical protein GW17_00028572 [Ensete ventricosum]
MVEVDANSGSKKMSGSGCDLEIDGSSDSKVIREGGCGDAVRLSRVAVGGSSDNAAVHDNATAEEGCALQWEATIAGEEATVGRSSGCCRGRMRLKRKGATTNKVATTTTLDRTLVIARLAASDHSSKIAWVGYVIVVAATTRKGNGATGNMDYRKQRELEEAMGSRLRAATGGNGGKATTIRTPTKSSPSRLSRAPRLGLVGQLRLDIWSARRRFEFIVINQPKS